MTKENVDRVHHMLIYNMRLITNQSTIATRLLHVRVDNIIHKEVDMRKDPTRRVLRLLVLDQKRIKLVTSKRNLTALHNPQ